ncbi:MAG: DUF4840 domain-containing protein [Prevotella sp.]|jgi:hypothetical protein|nr:DUF4840 domain-containing protein [Prevotella sp.]MCH4017622.1 DUF4840 domain-containing protein [Prevotella sp.]MCH4185537.1 DUF4840 domain-containing protein [Prevotella sp.]MCH4216627.1 DUF4840 domain-containing protein [Prevotella sp.]MCH4252163.1 DUF4840 domain-containing protein [Prevotella sp.]
MMKKIHIIIFTFTVLAGFSLISCNKDDDNGRKELTKAEIGEALMNTTGEYTGPMTFGINELYKPNSTRIKIDTVFNMKWSVKKDTTLIIDHIPMKALADFITDTDLKEALMSAQPQALTCHIDFFDNDPIQFYLTNIKPQTYYVTYGGKQHEVTIDYDTRSFSPSWGAFDYQRSNDFFANIFADKIKVDGVVEDKIGFTSNCICVTTKKDGRPFDIH